MLKFYRNVLAAGVVTLGLAACGDDVTVQDPPTPPPPGVTSVVVAPSNQVMTVGQNVVFAAAVTADAGVATTVNWTSSAPTIATVDGTGKVTAVAPGTTTIIATSTADAGKKGIASVTVNALPSGIVSFGVSPTTSTIAPGQVVQASAQLVTVPGQTGTVTWASTNPAVATVNATTGAITGVAAGTTTIRATATVGTSTATADIGLTVRPIVPATLSINSITAGLLTLPVVLTNVAGQIEVNMNFAPGEQTVDSINVFIGNKRAAKAIYTTNPAAGLVSLSINTADFITPANSPTATVTYANGATSVTAVVYPRGAQSTATQATQIVLNNVDGWAGSITKPTVVANNAGGITYWGGPTANTSAQIWAVQYNTARNGVETVTWTVGGCPTTTAGGVVGVQITTPLTRTFGYTANGAQTGCTAYENLGGTRDNIIVTAAIDGVNNGYPLTPLIANTVVLGATPDSLRLDYKAPAVSTPSITRTAPAVTGWVNGTFNFINFASADAGVGIRATRDRAVSYTSVNCPTVTATNVAMPNGTGADINGAVACPTNNIGGAPGLGGTAPWTVRGTESDRLGNVGTSTPTATFGTDYTAPGIRWGLVDGAFTLPAAYGGSVADPVDSIYTAKPVAGTNEFRAEYLDERSGFFNAGQPSGGAAAQAHALSIAGHVNNAGACVVGTAPIGATFVTNPGCGLVAIATGTAGVRLDGWQPGMRVNIPAGESYYGYKTNVTDAAGNTSVTLFRRVLVNTIAPFNAGLLVPATLTSTAFNFTATYADSAEVTRQSLQVTYPSLPTVDSVRYPRTSIGANFDDVITSPFNGNNAPPTGAPYAHSIEIATGAAFPASNVNGAGVQVKPTKAQAWGWNPGNFFLATTEVTIPALIVENNANVATYNAANPTIAVNHFRVIPTVATSNQFGSTVPLRAQATSPTNSPNPPFARVDFYRLVGGTYWSYLGSVNTSNVVNSVACSNASALVCGTDQGTYRSWVYQLPTAYQSRFDGASQGVVVSTDVVIAVGVLSTGDAMSTVATTMP